MLFKWYNISAKHVFIPVAKYDNILKGFVIAMPINKPSIIQLWIKIVIKKALQRVLQHMDY